MSYVKRSRVVSSSVIGEGKDRSKVVLYNNGTKVVVPVAPNSPTLYSIFTTSTFDNVVSLQGEYSSLSYALSKARSLLRRLPDCKLVQVFCKGKECYSFSRS